MSLVLDNPVSMRWCFADGSATDLTYADHVLDSLRDDAALMPGAWPCKSPTSWRAQKRASGSAATRALASSRNCAHCGSESIRPPQATLVETLEIERRHRLSAYDAADLELAVRRQLPLVTLDTILRKAARRARADLS